MKLKSINFKDNDMIPLKFTCDGEDISPQLSWEGAPSGTQSFALSVEDPDAPMGTFIHWLVYDVPRNFASIEEASLPEEAQQVANDFGKVNYGGPCPPSGTHHYIFTIYALDVKHLEGVNKNSFFARVKDHTIEKASITGLYKRR